ncbi:MAG: hypothetical protein HY537_07315 [Deltaproteobacteria bacterium]|nr:hypothetical protein [Deltaproteobacteria bacterium]
MNITISGKNVEVHTFGKLQSKGQLNGNQLTVDGVRFFLGVEEDDILTLTGTVAGQKSVTKCKLTRSRKIPLNGTWKFGADTIVIHGKKVTFQDRAGHVYHTAELMDGKIVSEDGIFTITRQEDNLLEVTFDGSDIKMQLPRIE